MGYKTTLCIPSNFNFRKQLRKLTGTYYTPVNQIIKKTKYLTLFIDPLYTNGGDVANIQKHWSSLLKSHIYQ